MTHYAADDVGGRAWREPAAAGGEVCVDVQARWNAGTLCAATMGVRVGGGGTAKRDVAGECAAVCKAARVALREASLDDTAALRMRLFAGAATAPDIAKGELPHAPLGVCRVVVVLTHCGARRSQAWLERGWREETTRAAVCPPSLS